jgi:hypothetical protein
VAGLRLGVASWPRRTRRPRKLSIRIASFSLTPTVIDPFLPKQIDPEN